MKKCLTIAAVAGWVLLSAGANCAMAQRGVGSIAPRNSGGSGSGVYYPRFRGSPNNFDYGLRLYYSQMYPYNTASETFAGGMPEDYSYGDLAGTSASGMPLRYNPNGGDASAYGADVYALLRRTSAQPGGATERRALYAPTPLTNEAAIRVRVPDPEARVSFDDALTRQTGDERTFTSPPLSPGKTYTYTISATWLENGREVTRSKDVKVEAGRAATVDFLPERKTPDK
jgi:uncharacterized protein (TIGR03000 family)